SVPQGGRGCAAAQRSTRAGAPELPWAPWLPSSSFAPNTPTTNARRPPPSRATQRRSTPTRAWARPSPSDSHPPSPASPPPPPAPLPSDPEAPDAYSRVVTTVAERLSPSVANLRVSRRVRGGRRLDGAGSGAVITPDGVMTP